MWKMPIYIIIKWKNQATKSNYSIILIKCAHTRKARGKKTRGIYIKMKRVIISREVLQGIFFLFVFFYIYQILYSDKYFFYLGEKIINCILKI